MARIMLRLLAGLATVLVTVPIAPIAAAAQPTTPAVTWAVQPANEHGPDGRRWVELTLDPGQRVTEHVAVRNFSDRTVVFSLKAADGYLTDNGRFNMLPSNQASVDGGTWIEMREQVTVGAGETQVVPFTITVPSDATPGDHPAGVAATVTSTGGTVAVESRVGFRVMMRVSGTVTAAVAITDLAATYQHSWDPFTAGTIHVTYTATNEGNVAVTGTGQAAVAGPFDLAKTEAPTEVEEMFPGDSWQVDTRIAGVWPWGPLRTSVEVTLSVDEDGPAGAAVHPASATVTVWTVPGPQLVLAAIAGALAVAFRTIIRRRRRRLAQLLARAREEGRAAASRNGPDLSSATAPAPPRQRRRRSLHR